MTVKELINELSKYESDADVYFQVFSAPSLVYSVQKETIKIDNSGNAQWYSGDIDKAVVMLWGDLSE